MTKLQEAFQQYIARRDRLVHPDGNFDKGGRWYPSRSESQSCCRAIRQPSRAWPWSYMTHCRTKAHVANLYGVDPADFRIKR